MIKPTSRQLNARKTRELLLEAASTLFDQYGFSAVTVSDICERAGLTKGAFYHHFASKEEAMNNVFTPQLDDYLDKHYDVPEGADARAMLKELARCTYRFSRHIGRELTRESHVLLLRCQVSTLFVEQRRHNRLLRAALRRAREEGSFRAEVGEDEAVILYAGMMLGFLVKWSTHNADQDPPIDWDRLLEQEMDLLFTPGR